MLKAVIKRGGRKAYTTPNKYTNENSLFYKKLLRSLKLKKTLKG
jgi:hypothetical protein